MLSFSSVARIILAACPEAARPNLYGFGSRLVSPIGNDFDVLLVSDTEEDILAVKMALDTVGRDLPIDLTVLSPNELAETDFVAKWGCKHLDKI